MKIILERPNCIGCGSCVAVCEQYFEIADDGKSHLKDSQKEAQDIEMREVAELGCAKEAAEICPVQVIKIE